MTSFTTWLKRQRDRQCPVGDLARDMYDDKDWPKDSSDLSEYSWFEMYLRHACEGARRALRTAWSEYDQFIGNFPTGFVYLVQSGEDGPIKIGYTDDPEKRLSQLQTGNPHHLILRLTVPGSRLTERRLHLRFEKHHLRGEWFRPDFDIVDFIYEVQEGSEPGNVQTAVW